MISKIKDIEANNESEAIEKAQMEVYSEWLNEKNGDLITGYKVE